MRADKRSALVGQLARKGRARTIKAPHEVNEWRLRAIPVGTILLLSSRVWFIGRGVWGRKNTLCAAVSQCGRRR